MSIVQECYFDDAALDESIMGEKHRLLLIETEEFTLYAYHYVVGI